MIVSIILPAAPGERYAPDAFADNLSKPFTLRGWAGQKTTGTVTKVSVAQDGSYVEMTLDIEDA